MRTACNVGTEMLIISGIWHRIKRDFLARDVDSEVEDKKLNKCIADVESAPLNQDLKTDTAF